MSSVREVMEYLAVTIMLSLGIQLFSLQQTAEQWLLNPSNEVLSL